MRTGIQAAEESIARSGTGGGTGRYLSYFSLSDKEQKILRFLTDGNDIITTKFYEFVVGPDDKSFQTFVVATDLYADEAGWNGDDWVTKYGGKCRDYKTKELVDPVARERTVGIAVEREEYHTEVNGKKVTRTRDKIVEIEDKEGKKHLARNYFIVKQSGKNFWNAMVAYYHEFGTLCDRDYKITRSGSDTSTSYSIIPKSGSEDNDWDHGGASLKQLQAVYGYGTGQDMEGNEIANDSPDRFLYARQTLLEWVEEAASEDRAKSFLKGKAAAPSATEETRPKPGWAGGDDDEPNIGSAGGGTTSTTVAPPAVTADMASLRARLDKHT